MNLKHLRYFLAVAEEKSFIRAAHRAHIEPSPLSKAVKALESQLGVHLLHRNKGSVQLTGPGKVLEEEARNIIAQVENAKSRVYSASRGFKRQLRIGLPDGLLPPQLAELLARSREKNPRRKSVSTTWRSMNYTPPCDAARSTWDLRWMPGSILKASSGSRHGGNAPLSPCRSDIHCSFARRFPFTRRCIIR
jgi:molybdenum-dependent DNA-binding transcriptional regulator ModE